MTESTPSPTASGANIAPHRPPSKPTASARQSWGGGGYLDVLELRASIDALLVAYPELKDDDTLRADTFEGMTNLNDVIASLLEQEREAEAMEAAIDTRIDDLRARKSREARRKETRRTLIQSLMERASLNKLVLPEATISLSTRAPAPIVTNEEALPDYYTKVKRVADMEKIKGAISGGFPLPPGVSMSNGKSVLSIRAK